MPGPADSPGQARPHDLQGTVEQAIEDEVEEQFGGAEERIEAAGRSAWQAEAGAKRAEAGAREAEAGAEQAESAAEQAALLAAHAAAEVDPDDPLLDTTIRKIEAQVTEHQPFGIPGRPMSKRSPFRVAFTAAMGVALAYGLVQSFIAVRSVLVLLLVSAFLAIGLNPIVEFFERRKVRRGGAVAIVLAGVLLVLGGFLSAIVPPIIDQGSQFKQAAPGYVRDLQTNRQVKSLDDRFHFLATLQDYSDNPDKLAPKLVGGVIGVGKVVFSAFFSALTFLILTLYFLSSLPAMKNAAYRLVPRSRRARVGLLADEILERVGSYVGGLLTIAACAGVSTFLLLTVLGVPYPLALALVVALTDLVPLVGATIGAILVTLVALLGSVHDGVIAALFYLLYQQVENFYLYPRIMKKSVDVSSAATVVAVLIGGSLLGVIGALLAIPIAAAVQLVLQEVVFPRQDET